MKNITLFFLFILPVLPGIAQPPKIIRQLDGRKVLQSDISTTVQKIVDTGHIAGLQIVILNGDRMVYQHSFGWKDMEKQLPLDNNTEMYAASMTKPVSAYLFLWLVDKGIFDLDRPVYQYLKKPIGEYAKWKDLADDTASFNLITARMLMSHSSGMPVLRVLYNNKLHLIARPGEKFYYSNEGLNFLGFIMEEHTGKKLETLAKEEIFGPLDMKQTSMVWDTAFEQNYSLAYFKDGKKFGMEKRESARAAGSMTSTAGDYSKFVVQLMYQKGLSPSLYHQMMTPQIRLTSKRGFGPAKDSTTHEYDSLGLSWGLGLCLFHSKYGNGFLHVGHGDANQNYFVTFPDKKIAVILFSNSENFEHAAWQILDACIADRQSPLEWLGYMDN